MSLAKRRAPEPCVCVCVECHVVQPGKAWHFFTWAEIEIQRYRMEFSETLPHEHDLDNKWKPSGKQKMEALHLHPSVCYSEDAG